MKNICVVTGSRAEYGILKSLIDKLDKKENINVDIIITAMHLEKKYGNTYKIIENDGFNIAKKIHLNLKETNKKTLSTALATLTNGLVECFEEKRYDLIIILGDRYEMLPVANVALIYNIPICHLHGGEKTLGNFDEAIRHALTKMSHLHLVSTEEFRKRVIQLGESVDKVFNIGAIGVENVVTQKFLAKEYLEKKLGIIFNNDYYVVLFHPVTLEEGFVDIQVKELLSALRDIKEQIIFIGSNSDTGSDVIMNMIEEFVSKRQDCYLFSSLTTTEYHSLVKYSKGLIGNSSSGIIEVPSLNVPTLNIGNRQLGRVSGESVVHVDTNKDDILKGINKLVSIKKFDNPYYKKNSSTEAVKIILEYLENIDLIKEFNDIKF